MQGIRTHAERRWRKKAKRGVSPIIATILLVAITVVLAAVLYILISGLTKGPGNTPIGTALAMGTFSEATSGAGAGQKWYYNATVQSASGGMTWSNMIFQVQTPSGGIVAAGPTTITTTNAALSCNIATYTFATATWGAPAANVCAGVTTGGGGLVVSGAQLQLTSTVVLQTLGNKVVAVGQGSFSGTASFAIP
ncbi:MAG: type IV pilin [Thermoplasmata archaeon]|nr:type IV pilin [Thermoplasmata archaeon]